MSTASPELPTTALPSPELPTPALPPSELPPVELPEREMLADLLADCASRAGVAGAQLSVVGEGGRVDLAWGRAGPQRTLEVGDRIQVGSIAKLMTAVLVHQLVDDGGLSLGDEVGEIGSRLGDLALAASTGITVGQLLSMTSGLDEGIWAAGQTVAEALRPQLTLPRRAGAGSFGYSMSGTMIAARLVELLRGTSWWDAVGARIAAPLGLALADRPDSPGHEVGTEGWTLVSGGALPGMAPTGTTLCASAAGLATFARALADERELLLSAASRHALHDAVAPVGALMCADSWCSGPYSRRAGDRVLHGHGGRWAGGVSDLSWNSASRTAVAIVTNTPARGGELVRELSRAIHPLLWGADAFVETREVDAGDPARSTEELDALTGSYRTATRRYQVDRSGDRLLVEVTPLPHPDAVFQLPGGRTEFVAVGRRRFLPVHETREERRLQELWFSDEPAPAFCYDGFTGAARQSGIGPS